MLKTLSLLILFTSSVCAQQRLEVDLDLNTTPKPITRFWSSSGFSPADMLLTPKGQRYMETIGELPDNGTLYMRPHYLLNLVSASGFSQQSIKYDWTSLDRALDILVKKNGFKLIFELMGYPALDPKDIKTSQYDANFQKQTRIPPTYFTDLEQPEQIRNYKQFIKDLALHLIQRYGREEVRSWYFETTNEPDLKSFWPFSKEAFLNYYDACSEGLREADSGLRFGGPGTAKDLSETFRLLLAHCDTGQNFFTKERGVRLDFISVHVKAMPRQMIEREKKIIDYIRENHPKFSSRPFINDESDSEVGWSKDIWLRNSPWYAAFIAQSVDLHQRVLVDSMQVDYRIMSNDNAFYGGWNARSICAAIKSRENPEMDYLVKKPMYNVMSYLSQLGDRWIPVQVKSDNMGLIATRNKTGYSILVYNKSEFDNASSEPSADDR
jgi:L-iduronidase